VLDARFGLNRGFDVYDDRYGASSAPASFHFVERPADQVQQAATAWIARPTAGDERPWFAWVHLFDPHAPYRPPVDFARGRAPYDGEIAWTDAALGKTVDDLRGRGQLDRTVIVVTADHGESLGEHGETTHGLFAYDATLRVPLIVVGPGLAPREVTIPTAHVDIVPTLLDLLTLPWRGGLDGRSLRDEIAGTSSARERRIHFETLDASLTRGWAPLRGIIEGP
jgi:arylsulfatase A-like enzyme